MRVFLVHISNKWNAVLSWGDYQLQRGRTRRTWMRRAERTKSFWQLIFSYFLGSSTKIFARAGAPLLYAALFFWCRWLVMDDATSSGRSTSRYGTSADYSSGNRLWSLVLLLEIRLSRLFTQILLLMRFLCNIVY